MKYYICITPFFPEPDYFVGPYVLDQVKAIKRNSDYEVIVMKPFSALHPKPNQEYEYEGVKVYRFSDYTIPSNLLPNGLSDKLTYNSFRKKLKELGIEPADIQICHAHVGFLGSTAIRLKHDFPHIKAVVQHHGFDVMSETDGRFASFNWHKNLCKKHGAYICNEADLNIGVSSRTLDYVKAVPGVKLKNEYVLYNGVDTTKFFKTSTPTHNKIFTIGCVANFWKLKDQLTLIKAVELLAEKGQENIKVIFIGTGYTRNACQKYISDKGLEKYFEFRETMHHKFLPDFYRSLDLFVLPSYWEAFGCVYTEAYSCGIPFVGVKGQGISELIPEDEKDKWLIDKGDFTALASIIERVMTNKDETQKLISSVDINVLIKQYLTNLERF